MTTKIESDKVKNILLINFADGFHSGVTFSNAGVSYCYE